MVQARKPPGNIWYNAKVVEKIGRRRVVHYIGFPKSHRRTFGVAQRAIRARRSPVEVKAEQWAELDNGNTAGLQPDGSYLIERILQKRKTKKGTSYLVRWEGWSSLFDVWRVASTLPPEIVDEFEEEARALAKEASKPKRAPRVAFTLELTRDEPTVVLELRKADAADFFTMLSTEATTLKLSRQRGPLAEIKILSLKVCSGASCFNGFRESLRERAAALPVVLQGDRDADDLVTPISSHKGGDYPVDTFSVMDDSLINDIVGDGVFTIHTSNGSAVKLVPPFDFFLRARRDEQGELRPVKEVIVKVHFAALVANHADPTAPLFRTDVSFTYPAADLAAYKDAMAQQLVAAVATAPAEFVAWAQDVLG